MPPFTGDPAPGDGEETGGEKGCDENCCCCVCAMVNVFALGTERAPSILLYRIGSKPGPVIDRRRPRAGQFSDRNARTAGHHQPQPSQAT